MAKSSTTVRVAEGIGAGIAVVGAAAAAGYYFYASDKAKQHRKVAAKWATEMKNEVIKDSKRLQAVSPKTVATIVDAVAQTYRDVKNIDAKELKKASRELKSNWKKIKDEAGKSKKQITKAAKKSVRKTLKKN